MDHKLKRLPPAPSEPRCPTCGEYHSMTLSEDRTERSKLAFEDGKWVKVGVPKSYPLETDSAVRMFCTNCGEYFEVPDGLT